MSDLYQPPERVRIDAHIASVADYKTKYEESIKNPAKFWGAIASEFFWKQPPSEEKFLEFNFDVTKGPIDIKWMQDGKTNICYNCLDRHLDQHGDQASYKVLVGI